MPTADRAKVNQGGGRLVPFIGYSSCFKETVLLHLIFIFFYRGADSEVQGSGGWWYFRIKVLILALIFVLHWSSMAELYFAFGRQFCFAKLLVDFVND